MAKSLKRSLDFKLVYDCLADSRGRVRLDLLLSHWPTDTDTSGACESFWRQKASPEGFLDWTSFFGGLQAALQQKDGRCQKSGQSSMAAARCPVAQVTSGEIELFLSSCRSSGLAKALEKAGRDVHRWQVSIHKEDSHKEVVSREKEQRAGRQHNRQQSTGLSAAREKEELLRGAEVLQNTQRWFQSRLAFLSAQQKQTAFEKLGPEEVLAELDAGEEDSPVLHHLKQINNHLSSLALTANSPPPPTPPQQPTSLQGASAVVEYPIHRVQPQIKGPSRVGRGKQPLVHHTRKTAGHTVARPPATTQGLLRSSSFTDKSSAGFRGQPVRQASSMTTLTQQVTDYPGHRAFASLEKPIRHSSSVQSLPGHKTQNLLFPRPPARATSTRSLSREHHLVSEVL